MEQVHGFVVESSHLGQRIRFFVANEGDHIQKYHARGRFYEVEELEIIARHLRPGAFVADIGANVGNHCVFMGRFLHPAQIVVIEPTPAAIAVLRLNIALNGLDRVVDGSRLGLGLGQRKARANPATPANNLGGTRLRPAREDDADALVVVPGDEIFADRRVDFVKMDVEGMEMQALKGLAETIGRWRPTIFVEVHNNNAEAFQAWVRENRYHVAETFRRYATNENFLVVPAEAVGVTVPGVAAPGVAAPGVAAPGVADGGAGAGA